MNELNVMQKGKRDWVTFMQQAIAYKLMTEMQAVSVECGLPHKVVPEVPKNPDGTPLWEPRAYWRSALRADVIAVKSDRKTITIVETKSCWSDFSSDRKWTAYLPFCSKFYFAADADTARKIADWLVEHPDVGKSVGVLRVLPPESDVRGGGLAAHVDHIRGATIRKHDMDQEALNALFWQMAMRNAHSERIGHAEI